MAGNFDFLHIKQRTVGSSNELSFDVLEHKSAEASGKAPRTALLPKAPKASQGSYHGVAGTSTLSGQEEVEKRKKARRWRRIRLQVVAVIAIIALIAVGVYSGMRVYEDKMDFAGRVNVLVDRLIEADVELSAIDGMMSDPLDGEKASERSEALSKMPKLTTELNRLSVDAQSLVELADEDKNRALVDQISKAALARNGMISIAAEAFRLSSESSDLEKHVNRIWSEVLNADQMAREAISAANKATTPEAASSALDSLHAASDGFESAMSEMQDASAAYGVDFSAQQAYLAKKGEAMGYAIETSEALLEGNRDAAKEASSKYNVADAEAVQIASGLPPSPSTVVQEKTESMMDELLERYSEARNRTVEIDSIIREYLE